MTCVHEHPLDPTEQSAAEPGIAVHGGQKNTNQIQPLVVVILSASDGASNLEAQVRSILNQTWPNLRLLVHNDAASEDAWTTQTAEDAAHTWRLDPRVLILPVHRTGQTPNPLQLLGMIDAQSEFMSFVGAAEVWHPEKLARAMACLLPCADERPALYTAEGMGADEALNAIGALPAHAISNRTTPANLRPKRPKPSSFGNALIENLVKGKTMVLNPPAVALLKSAGVPAEAITHDWWASLVVAAFGQVVCDPCPPGLGPPKNEARAANLALRRQSANAESAWFLKPDNLHRIVAQAASFRSHFGAMPSLKTRDRRVLDRLVRGSALDRCALAFGRHLSCQRSLDDALLRMRLLAGPWPDVCNDLIGNCHISNSTSHTCPSIPRLKLVVPSRQTGLPTSATKH